MAYGRSYAGDPRWMSARFDSTGACGCAIKTGARIFYYPNGKRAYCETHGQEAAADFNSHAFDEAAYASF